MASEPTLSLADETVQPLSLELSAEALQGELKVEEMSTPDISNALSTEAQAAVEEDRKKVERWNRTYYLRELAIRQRQWGKEELEKRFDGVLSYFTDVEIFGFPVYSVFIRNFGYLNTAIYYIDTFGQVYLGKKEHSQLMGLIDKRITQMEEVYKKDREATDELLKDVHLDNLSYTASYKHSNIQVSTIYGMRILNLFLNNDKLVTDRNKLMWGQILFPDMVKEEERAFKTQMKTFQEFVRQQRNRIAKLDRAFQKELKARATPKNAESAE